MKKKSVSKRKPKSISSWKKDAQTTFNTFIRIRDGKCLRCGKKENLTASHFFKVGFENVRFDEDNVVALCYRCHYGAYSLTSEGFIGWEYDHEGYRSFMVSYLGEERFKELEKRARLYAGWRIDDLKAIIEKYKRLSTP